MPLDSRDAQNWLRFNSDRSPKKIAWFNGLEKVRCKVHWTEDQENNVWEGQLHRVIKFDQKTRTIAVAIRINGKSALSNTSSGLPLVEGMFCSVRIPGRTLHNVFRLPRQAVSFKNTVHISKNSRLKTVPVKVARIEGENAYVSAGLNPVDMVITTLLTNPLENSLFEITNLKTKGRESK